MFDDESISYIGSKQSVKKTWLTKRIGVYFYEMWVRKTEKRDRMRTTINRAIDVDVDMQSVKDQIASMEGIIAKSA